MGYEGASTRDIAKAADATMSSITYHFGGKQNLYLAAAEHIAAMMRERLRPVVEALEQRWPATPEEAVEGCVAYIDGFAAIMLSPDSTPWARFIIREQFEATEAFERIWSGLMTEALAILLDLTGSALPSVEDLERRALVILMLGQAITLRASHASVRRILACEDIEPALVALLRRRLASNVRALLRDDSDRSPNLRGEGRT